ncbi:hypothetical protein GOODEAATRI_031340 [Goodea atripinnis]|uniref:Uncharacterized protein n=1 Tax=Goodea atripinnis TaxID=208336 RepID=A0ABV0N818_9TELE
MEDLLIAQQILFKVSKPPNLVNPIKMAMTCPSRCSWDISISSPTDPCCFFIQFFCALILRKAQQHSVHYPMYNSFSVLQHIDNNRVETLINPLFERAVIKRLIISC